MTAARLTGFPFRTIVFDLDGTLADTSGDLAAALNHTLMAMDRAPVSVTQVLTMIGHGTRSLLWNGLAATGMVDNALVDQGYPVLMRFYEDHICDLTRPYPGIERAMDALADKDVALAVCTNKPSGVTRVLLNALGWQKRFAAVIGGDTLPVSKPDAAPLRLAIELAGGGPAAFVGDSIVDIQTALAAEVPGVAVSFGFADGPVSALGATATIDSFDELIPTLFRMTLPNGNSDSSKNILNSGTIF